MASSPARSHLPPAVLLAFILAAVGFGVAAVLLSAPAAPPPAIVTSPSGGFTLNDTAILSELLLLALIVVPIVLFLIKRARGEETGFPTRYVTVVLVIMLLLTVFVFLFHFPGVGVSCSGQSCTGTGGSGGETTPPGGTGNNSTLPPSSGNFSSVFGFAFPSWTLWLLVIAVAAVAVLVVAPLMLARLEPLSDTRRKEREMRADLASAIAELSSATGGTPRERVIRVYAKWLGRITRGAGDVTTLTAREIEGICVDRLGIRSSTAHALTTLFEEARYSSHPMGEEMVVRAQDALTRALAEFDQLHAAPGGRPL